MMYNVLMLTPQDYNNAKPDREGYKIEHHWSLYALGSFVSSAVLAYAVLSFWGAL